MRTQNARMANLYQLQQGRQQAVQLQSKRHDDPPTVLKNAMTAAGSIRPHARRQALAHKYAHNSVKKEGKTWCRAERWRKDAYLVYLCCKPEGYRCMHRGC